VWGEIGPSIERRLHGHLAGTIGHEGVLGPDELSIWEGKPADVHLRLSDAYIQGSFGVCKVTRVRGSPSKLCWQ